MGKSTKNARSAGSLDLIIPTTGWELHRLGGDGDMSCFSRGPVASRAKVSERAARVPFDPKANVRPAAAGSSARRTIVG